MFFSRTLSLSTIVLSTAGMITACANVADDSLVIDDNQVDLSWEEFLTMVYQEPDTGIYIVNGDEPIV
ncbi:MAG: hypothetical protein AAGC55_25835, partial [Myxococcota bacterium]